MPPRIGYLLPTREAIMEGRPEAAPLLRLGDMAEDLGYDSVWIGDSLTARPRHEPITMLAAVAGRTKKVQLGTAVLLPALRNPVLLAHEVATLDQISEGRFILGVGIATDVPNIRAEFESAGVPFEKRVGRMMEGLRLCKALWTGEPVNWAGRWQVVNGTVGPTPYRKGGPPIWGGGSVPAALQRAGRYFDGWFPNGPTPEGFAEGMKEVREHARAAGRDPNAVEGAFYFTLYIDEDEAKAGARIDEFLSNYYGARPDVLKKRQACFAGSVEGAAEWLKAYADNGVTHMVLRFAGDHERHLEMFTKVRQQLGW